jgi:transposase
MTIIRIGLDIAKHIFQVHGVDENEQTVVRRQLRRGEMGKFFTKQAPTHRPGSVWCLALLGAALARAWA